eukprot:15481354-Alexandrium_andersonii.AAC.1
MAGTRRGQGEWLWTSPSRNCRSRGPPKASVITVVETPKRGRPSTPPCADSGNRSCSDEPGCAAGALSPV